MAKKYRPSGVIYTPVPEKKSSAGDILGGIVMFVIGFVVLASCVG